MPRRRVHAAAAPVESLDLDTVPKVTYNDGSEQPIIGFGTYKVGFIPASASSAEAAGGSPENAESLGASAREIVRQAADIGYRFFDCAEFYGNEKEVGLGLTDSGVPREKLFLESKIWTTTIYQGEEAIRKQVDQTLKDLNTDYLDLYCIHWPVPRNKHIEAYLVLEALQKEGKIRSLGVSNYAIEDYKALMEKATVKPCVNQIEVNPFLYRKKTIHFFEDEGVRIQSYRALRDGKAFDHPIIESIATRYGKTPAQILGRWCVQKGVTYIPKSVRPDRMRENAQVFDFELSDFEMNILDERTSGDSLKTFEALYRKCVVRDTPLKDVQNGEWLTSPVTVE